MSLLLDSDVVISLLRKTRPVRHVMTELLSRNERLYYTPITRAEIFAGMRAAEEKHTRAVFDLFTCLPIGQPIGEIAGFYLALYRGSHGLEIADALIAASARHYQMKLWTYNRKHYPMPDIELFPPPESIH